MRASVRFAIVSLSVLAACTAGEDPADLGSSEQALGPSGTGRYMVACPAGCDESLLRSAVASRGGEHGPAFGNARGIVAALGPASAASLRADGYIVEEDAIARADGKPTKPPPSQVTPWGITRIGAPDAWPTTRGAGALVIVIDSGMPSHADLPSGACANFTNERNCSDGNGHSTHVSGTIAARDDAAYVVGAAPDAALAWCKALNRSGSGYYSWIISCIDWSVAQGADVINMSLGGSTGSDLLEQACDDADAAGVLVVAAAGNSGPGATGYPAAYASVVSVGATDADDAIAGFSNTNADVELSAPGVDVLSTCKGGGLCSYNGTSMASPHVAAAAALARSAAPGLSNDCLRALLADTSTDLGPDGRDAQFGFGLVDAAAAVGAAGAYACP